MSPSVATRRSPRRNSWPRWSSASAKNILSRASGPTAMPIGLNHLVKTRKWKGFVMRSVMTSSFIDAVARHYNLPVKETPVGFKYIAEGMKSPDFLMGGEESGGLTIRGHVPEKDGILACLLMAEVRAVEKKSFRQILQELRRQAVPYLSNRIHLTPNHPEIHNF